MKKLAILCALACALVACEKPMNEEEKKTASFSTIIYTDNISVEKQRKPMIYLVSAKTLDEIIGYHEKGLASGTNGVCSWKVSHLDGPTYCPTPYDLLDLFRTQKVSSIQTDSSFEAAYKDIPYGDYAIIYAMPSYYEGSLVLSSAFYAKIKVNDELKGKQILMPSFTYLYLLDSGLWKDISSIVRVSEIH